MLGFEISTLVFIKYYTWNASFKTRDLASAIYICINMLRNIQ